MNWLQRLFGSKAAPPLPPTAYYKALYPGVRLVIFGLAEEGAIPPPICVDVLPYISGVAVQINFRPDCGLIIQAVYPHEGNDVNTELLRSRILRRFSDLTPQERALVFP